MRVLTDAELDEFIEDAERKHEHNDDWWNMDFYEEAIVVANELKLRRAARREANESTDR